MLTISSRFHAMVIVLVLSLLVFFRSEVVLYVSMFLISNGNFIMSFYAIMFVFFLFFYFPFIFLFNNQRINEGNS